MLHGPFRHRRGDKFRRQNLPDELSHLFGLGSSTDPGTVQPTPTSIVDSSVAVTVPATSAITPVSPTSQAQPSPSILSSTLTSSSTPSTTQTTSTTPSSSSVISTPLTTAQPSPSPSPSSASTLTFFTVSSEPAVSGTSSARPSSTNSAVGGASTGIIAGGILAAIVAIAGIVFAILYFLRKSHRDQDEALAEEIWSRPEARRQSVLLPDEPGPVGPYNAMGAPRPPTMIERHLNSMPSPLSRQPTMPNMYSNNGYGNGYGASESGQSSFYPGDVMTPTSSNPFISPYSQDVLASPVSSSVPDYHVASHLTSPVAPPQALTRSSSSTNQAAVIRQNSIPGGPHSPMVSSPNDTDPRYVELSRSSVTPSQGMQYEEINQKLHAPMSSVMATVPEESHDEASDNRMLSPNSDPSPRDEKESADVDPGTEQVVDASCGLDIEVPLPTPIMFEQTRISSNPPTLPEIRVPERSFSPVASLELPVPLSARESPSPFSVEFSDMRTPPPAGLKFTSSPLATSAPTSTEPNVIPPGNQKAEAKSFKRPDTVYTLYDEEDAYGGF
ncbi:hypothetical protein F5888DRAFT_1802691 [Russula emetica]|nr:hypothetical protein F5888DRAFT_1802691 [Russula emetica]